jgi:MFS family permease
MFYGWRVVAGAFVGMVLANGMFTYGFTVLVDPIREEFAASLEQVMYSLTLGTFFGLVFAPLTGVLVDRFSVRLIMTSGCLITALGLFAVSFSQSVGQFNLLVGVTMSLSMAMVSSMPGSAAVSRWFTASRGKALGIASMGTSLWLARCAAESGLGRVAFLHALYLADGAQSSRRHWHAR